MKKQHKSPCAKCPFSRKTKPGHLSDTNGPDMFIGQAFGPFFLPCYSTHDYSKDEERRNPDNPQCAGVAIFRANIGVDQIMPEGLLHLPPDENKVFASSAEFLAFHMQIPMLVALMWMVRTPPQELLERELKKKGVKLTIRRKVESRVVGTVLKIAE